jgi:hypothetical protein
MQKPNITMHIEKINNPVQSNVTVIESFEGIQKNNSRKIFFILLFLIFIMFCYTNYFF